MCQRHRQLFSQSKEPSSFATASAPLHYAPDLGLEPEHLVLDLTFDLAARRVSGSATTTVRARREGEREIVLDAVDLNVIEVKSADGTPLTHDYDGARIAITFEQPVPLGETRSFTVAYEVVSPITGLMFSENPVFIASDHETQRARYWIPCIDHPAVRTTLEVSLRAPASWQVLGPGVLESEAKHDDGTKTARWKLAQRCPAYLLCVAMGELARHEGGVHVGPDGSEVPIAFFCATAEGHKLERTFGPTKSMMDWMVGKLGKRFPFPKYYQFSVPAIGGAMENISLVSWDDFVLMDERAECDRRLRIDTINVHEMAHSYFGDAVVIRDYAHAWLKESWASYMESVWIEDVLGIDDAAFYRSEEVRDYRGEADGRYRRPIVTRAFDSAWDMFDMHLYPGGAARLHMLRCKVGDRAFWQGVRAYLSAFDGKTAETADFQRCLEESSGLSLQKFFDQWLLSRGYPQIEAKYAWDEKTRTASLTLEQTQKNEDEEIGLFELPFTIAFEVGGEWHERSVCLKDARAELKAVFDHKPTSVVIDPRGDLVFSLTWKPGHELLVRGLSAPTVPGRIQAVRALGDSASPKDIAALEARWADEPFYGVRIEMARALGDAGTAPAAAAIARLLHVEKSDLVRIQLARAAGSYRDGGIESALVAFIGRDDVFQTGSEFALGAAMDSIGKQRGDTHLDLLRAGALEAPGWGWIQRGALSGLAETRSEGAVVHLMSALEEQRRRPVRIAAAEALGALGKWLTRSARGAIVDRLTDLTRDPDYGTRLAAVRGLSALGAHEAGAAFAAAEQDLARIRRAHKAAQRADDRGGPDQKLIKRIDELETRLRELEGKRAE